MGTGLGKNSPVVLTLGKDFLLLGSNYIKWLCEDSPNEGEAYSVTYKTFPTYKVVKAIPQYAKDTPREEKYDFYTLYINDLRLVKEESGGAI